MEHSWSFSLTTTSPPTSPASSPTSSPSSRRRHPRRLPGRHPHPLVYFRREVHRADAHLHCLRLQSSCMSSGTSRPCSNTASTTASSASSATQKSHSWYRPAAHRVPASSTRTTHCPSTSAPYSQRTLTASEEDTCINFLKELFQHTSSCRSSREHDIIHRLALQVRHRGGVHCRQRRRDGAGRQ